MNLEVAWHRSESTVIQMKQVSIRCSRVHNGSCFRFAPGQSGSSEPQPDFGKSADTSARNSSGGWTRSAQTVEHANDSHRYSQDEPEKLDWRKTRVIAACCRR